MIAGGLGDGPLWFPGSYTFNTRRIGCGGCGMGARNSRWMAGLNHVNRGGREVDGGLVHGWAPIFADGRADGDLQRTTLDVLVVGAGWLTAAITGRPRRSLAGSGLSLCLSGFDSLAQYTRPVADHWKSKNTREWASAGLRGFPWPTCLSSRPWTSIPFS
jgi:hypothetical protein